jgi:hypothetical protein
MRAKGVARGSHAACDVEASVEDFEESREHAVDI